MTKKIKKVKEVSAIIKPIANKSVQIPLAGVIIFSVLLAASSFFAGAAWLKMDKSGSTSTVKANATFEPSKSDKPDFHEFLPIRQPNGRPRQTSS